MDPIALFGPVPGGMEMMIILLIAVLLFGANKLPKLARSTGAAMGEFKKATSPPSEAREDAVERGSTSSRPGTDESIEHGSSNRDHASIDASESDSAADLKTDGGDGVTVRVGDLPSGFYVEDDGSGISEAVRETVFEAGYSTDSKGVGLGLTFVAQLVETYGWEYDVTESEAGGARFEFRGVDFS
jgi:TatA/E family protein of Tat protein translocase